MLMCSRCVSALCVHLSTYVCIRVFMCCSSCAGVRSVNIARCHYVYVLLCTCVFALFVLCYWLGLSTCFFARCVCLCSVFICQLSC